MPGEEMGTFGIDWLSHKSMRIHINASGMGVERDDFETPYFCMLLR